MNKNKKGLLHCAKRPFKFVGADSTKLIIHISSRNKSLSFLSSTCQKMVTVRRSPILRSEFKVPVAKYFKAQMSTDRSIETTQYSWGLSYLVNSRLFLNYSPRVKRTTDALRQREVKRASAIGGETMRSVSGLGCYFLKKVRLFKGFSYSWSREDG